MIGPLLLAAVAGLADFLGAVLALTQLQFSGRALLYLMGMSGGYLLTWTIAHLIPLLVQHQPALVGLILVGYFGLYILENLFASHAHPETSAPMPMHAHTLVDTWGGHTAIISPGACWAGVIGLFIHAFLDGVGIVASFLIHPAVGTLVFAAVFIHKVPEGSSLTSILGAARQGSRVVIWAAAGTALMTVAGGVAAWRIGVAEPAWSYPLLALSAGTFLFIGASNLIPATQKGESKGTVLAVLAGALAFYGVNLLLHAAGLQD